jgi:hypothetical protein
MSARELPGTGTKHAAKKEAKKAAKKVAKKAAKKVAKKAGKKGAKSAGHHLRRGYEHLHRLRIMAGTLEDDAMAEVRTLSLFAQAALLAQDDKVAADLLRAAEHIAFAWLAPQTADASISPVLAEALKDEYEHLGDRAAAEWEQQDIQPARAISAIFSGARRQAKAAWRLGAYHRALEFIRAADAIAHAAPGGLRLDRSTADPTDMLLGA